MGREGGEMISNKGPQKKNREKRRWPLHHAGAYSFNSRGEGKRKWGVKNWQKEGMTKLDDPERFWNITEVGGLRHSALLHKEMFSCKAVAKGVRRGTVHEEDPTGKECKPPVRRAGEGGGRKKEHESVRMKVTHARNGRGKGGPLKKVLWWGENEFLGPGWYGLKDKGEEGRCPTL